MTHVAFNTSKYLAAHGKSPEGRGNWGFAYKVGGQTVEVFFNQVTFGQAKKLMKQEAKAQGLGYVTATVLS